MLKLQKDIESDNLNYYAQERRRLDILARGASLKREELARRADEKMCMISDAERKLGLKHAVGRSDSPLKTSLPGVVQDFDTQSEFSVITNESEIGKNENVLDFVIENGEFYFE